MFSLLHTRLMKSLTIFTLISVSVVPFSLHANGNHSKSFPVKEISAFAVLPFIANMIVDCCANPHEWGKNTRNATLVATAAVPSAGFGLYTLFYRGFPRFFSYGIKACVPKNMTDFVGEISNEIQGVLPFTCLKDSFWKIVGASLAGYLVKRYGVSAWQTIYTGMTQDDKRLLDKKQCIERSCDELYEIVSYIKFALMGLKRKIDGKCNILKSFIDSSREIPFETEEGRENHKERKFIAFACDLNAYKNSSILLSQAVGALSTYEADYDEQFEIETIIGEIRDYAKGCKPKKAFSRLRMPVSWRTALWCFEDSDEKHGMAAVKEQLTYFCHYLETLTAENALNNTRDLERIVGLIPRLVNDIVCQAESLLKQYHTYVEKIDSVLWLARDKKQTKVEEIGSFD